jgi:hypothetical protein
MTIVNERIKAGDQVVSLEGICSVPTRVLFLLLWLNSLSCCTDAVALRVRLFTFDTTKITWLNMMCFFLRFRAYWKTCYLAHQMR